MLHLREFIFKNKKCLAYFTQNLGTVSLFAELSGAMKAI